MFRTRPGSNHSSIMCNIAPADEGKEYDGLVDHAQCHRFGFGRRFVPVLEPLHIGWSRTTVSCAAISHFPSTFLSTIRMRPSTVTPALVAW